MTTGPYPPCFPNRAHFTVWVRLADQTKQGNARLTYCTDCTPAYKTRMLVEQRCGHPEVQFVPEDDGGMAGVRPTLEELLA